MNSSSYRSERTKSYKQSAMSYHSRSSNAITPIASTSTLTQSPKGFRNFIGSGGVDSVVRQNGNNDGVKEKFGLLESTNQFNLLEYSAICRFILSEPGKESSLESILEHLELYYPEFSNVSGWEQKVERYLSDPNLFRFMEKKLLKAGHLVNLYGVVEGLTSIIEEEKEEELVIDENGQISERLERELKVTGWVPTPWLNITIGVLLYIEHVHKTEGHMLTIPEFTPWLRRNYSFFSSTSMKITEAIVKHQFTIYCDEEPPNKSLGIKTVYYTLKESQAELYRQYKNTKISALPKGPQYSDDLIGEFLTIFPSSFFDLNLWRLLIEE